jgi:Cof subfamily protein (haloacid dehalogenase superfamily)
MKKWKALVFFDLDGTLLDAESNISTENKQAIIALKQRNVLPIIASGRSPKEIHTLTRGTMIDSYVSLNGQYNVVEKKVVSKHIFPMALVEQLIDVSASFNHSLAFYTDKEYAACYKTASMEKLYRLDNAPLPKISRNFHTKNDLYMGYLFSEDKEKDAIYQEKFANTLTFFRDSPYSLAVVLKGQSKKTGIQQVINTLQLEGIPSYAFGDGNNDLGMFEAVQTAIAMENASVNVKQQADFITKSHVDGGICWGLYHFGLLQ